MKKPARNKALEQKKMQKVKTRKASVEQNEGTVVSEEVKAVPEVVTAVPEAAPVAEVVAEAEVVTAVPEAEVVAEAAVEEVAVVESAVAVPEATSESEIVVENVGAAPVDAPAAEESITANAVSVSEARAAADEVEQLLQKIKMEVTFSDKHTIVKEIYLTEEEAKEVLKTHEIQVPMVPKPQEERKSQEDTKPQEDTKMPWATVAVLSFIVCASLATGVYHWYNSYAQPSDPVLPAYVADETNIAPANEPDTINENQVDEPVEPEAPEIKRPRIAPPPEFAILWEEHGNEDIVAVLTLGEAEFTVVQGDDNAFYITHGLNRDPSSLGWVFMDSQVDLLRGLDHNMVIYDPVGGIMRDAIQEYAEYDFFLKFPTISFSTIYGDMEWEIFSYYVAPSDFPFDIVNHPNDDDWGDIVDQFTLASLYNTRLNVNMDDQILTIVVPTGIDPELFFILQARMLRLITS